MKKGLFALLAGFGLAVVSATPALATDSILFDPDGAGGVYSAQNINVMDPAPGNALSQGLTATSIVGSTGFTLFQANIAAFTQDGSGVFGFDPLFDPNLNFTIVAGFTEKIATVTGTGNTFSAPTLDGSLQGFFYIYAQPVTGNNLTGQCFAQCAGSTLLLSGQIINNANFFGNFDGNQFSPVADLDGFGTDNYQTIDTITGGGNFSVDIQVTQVNRPDYFPNLTAGSSLILATSQQRLNFLQADPSFCFSSNGIANCNVAGAQLASVGTVNGVIGPNTILQTDASLSFRNPSAVPEPATMTLLGIGLLGTAAARRRQMKKKSQ